MCLSTYGQLTIEFTGTQCISIYLGRAGVNSKQYVAGIVITCCIE